MFSAIEGMNPAYVLCGIIWALALGFAVGNYACSLVHRLPRNLPMLDKTPYCGSCGTLLKVKDLFPVVSALLLRHRCRYCGAPFPTSHTWTELLVGLLFVLAFFQHNFSEAYILIVTLGVFLITLAAIQANDGIIERRILLAVIVFGMLNRLFMDGTIYDFFEGGLFGLLAGAVLWRRGIKKVGHVYKLPVEAQLLAVGGLCAGSARFIEFLLLFAVFYVLLGLLDRLLGKRRAVLIAIPFGLAVMIPVLYPQLEILRIIRP